MTDKPADPPKPPRPPQTQEPAATSKEDEDDGLLCTFCGLKACWTK